MKPSLIVRTSAPLLLWMPAAMSIYVVLRGHNDPGGGFIGGLIAAAGILFHAIALGRRATLQILRVEPVALCGIGVLLAMVSGVPAWIDPAAGYLTHRWWFPDLGFVVPIGTAILFDLGVYTTVVGTVTAVFLALLEDAP